MHSTSRLEYCLAFLLIGGIIGWLAGLIVKGRGFGLVGDIAVGVIGSLLGGWIAGVIGVYAYSSLGAFLTALTGAVILVGLTRFFKVAP